MYLTIKIIHASCAILSVLGFAIRGFLKVKRNQAPGSFVFRVLPHIIDTILLLSAIVLVVMSGQYPFVVSWVTAKVIALIVYIGLGIVTMRSQATQGKRVLYYSLTLLTGLYILLVAASKNPIPFG
ncbi:MAG: SirB2 family protein [Gammaproteobacteria bacterium]|nr:SirB2 family protein [Pseudomonadales bacterium]MCP5346723.1 SirB2 family protein [Pseudomonadales bacterium]